MGIAALVLGIVSIIIAFIPICGSIAFLPAIVGLILGIVDVIQKGKKEEPKGVGIAGIVLSAAAVVIIFVWLFIISSGAGVAAGLLDDANKELNKIDWNETFNDIYE